MTTTYETKCWGEIYRIRADFSQAADQVQMQDEDGDWIATGRQVADHRHSSADAMRRVLVDVAEAGDNAEDETGRIDRAVSRMIEA